MLNRSATLAWLARKPGILIVFHCDVCQPRRHFTYEAREAAAIFGPATTLDQIQRKGICKDCGTRFSGPDGHLIYFDIDVTTAMYDELRADGTKVGGMGWR